MILTSSKQFIIKRICSLERKFLRSLDRLKIQRMIKRNMLITTLKIWEDLAKDCLGKILARINLKEVVILILGKIHDQQGILKIKSF